jgi:Arc/MetJ-type ribon-helix-helix transcriptional regulator
MVEGEGEHRGSEARRRRTGDIKETFSISINPQVRQAIDKEVEDGLWDSRSQAISHYVHLGREVEKHTRELAMRRVLMFDALSKTDEADCERIFTFLSLMENPEFRRRLKKQMEEGFSQR